MFVALHTESNLTEEQQRLFYEFTTKAGLTPTSIEEVDHHKHTGSIVDSVFNGGQKWNEMPVEMLNDITAIHIDVTEQVRINGADICITIEWKGQHERTYSEVQHHTEFLTELTDSIEMQALELMNGAIFGVVFGKDIPPALLSRIVNGEIDFPTIDNVEEMRNDIVDYPKYLERIQNRSFPDWGCSISVGYDS